MQASVTSLAWTPEDMFRGRCCDKQACGMLDMSPACWIVTVSGWLCSGDDSITSGMRRLGAVTTKTTVKCSFYDFTPCWIISDTTTRHDVRRSKHSSHRAGRREAVMLLGCWLGHNIIFKSASRPGRINLRFHLYTSTGGDIEF